MNWVAPWISGSLAAGGTMFVVGAAFHLGVRYFAPSIAHQFEELDGLFRPWPGWTESYMAIHPFVYGIIFAGAFLALWRWTAFPGRAVGGLAYGSGLFVAGSLPVFLLVFASLQVPPEIIVTWIAQSLVQYTFAGVMLGIVTGGPIGQSTK